MTTTTATKATKTTKLTEGEKLAIAMRADAKSEALETLRSLGASPRTVAKMTDIITRWPALYR